MARYWLGPWVWGLQAGITGWHPPAGTLGNVDLRAPVQCAQVAGSPSGVGMFVTPNATNLGSDYRNLGTDPQAVLTGAQKTAWRTLLGLPAPLAALDLEGALWETLTIQSDPIGNRCLPLVPTGRRFELWLVGSRVRNLLFDRDGPEAVPLRDLLQREYRRLRLASLAGEIPVLHYRKVLGYWVRKFGIPYRYFQPADLPDESDLPPETTITDAFTRSNADALGTSAEGWSWTEVTGDTDIESNTAVSQVSASKSRAESDLSSADHYAKSTLVTVPGGSGFGAAVRFAPAATTFYFYLTDDRRVFKCVTGTLTLLGSVGGGGTPGAGVAVKTQINGSTLKGYEDATEKISLTDTAITTGTRTGIYADSGVAVDNFEAADLDAGGQPALRRFGLIDYCHVTGISREGVRIC